MIVGKKERLLWGNQNIRITTSLIYMDLFMHIFLSQLYHSAPIFIREIKYGRITVFYGLIWPVPPLHIYLFLIFSPLTCPPFFPHLSDSTCRHLLLLLLNYPAALVWIKSTFISPSHLSSLFTCHFFSQPLPIERSRVFSCHITCYFFSFFFASHLPPCLSSPSPLVQVHVWACLLGCCVLFVT